VSAPIAAEEREYARWLAPISAIAVIAIGRALQIDNGALHPDAVFWIAIAFVLVLVAILVPRPVRWARSDARALPVLALAGLFVHIGQLHTSPPGRVDAAPLFHWGLAALAVIGAVVVRGAPRWAKPLQVGALVVVHFVLGAWMIHRVPDPMIDVHVFHRDAIAALRAGIDPYGITFPNIYPRSEGFYGPDLSIDGRLQFGFPYPPLSLLTALPGQLLGGDHRYAQLVAMELAALLMAFARPTGFGAMAAVLYLTTPRVFFVLEQSWTEPFVVLGLAAVVFASCRRSGAVPWLFGAFLALKQYLLFALPAALLLVPWPLNRRDIVRLFGRATVVTTVVTLPFFLWNPAGFWHSVVTLQLLQPFRTDALSFPAWWLARGHGQPPMVVAFAAVAIATVIAMRCLPRTPGGFGAAVAVSLFSFFVFNKQAFCNYYFFVIGALCATLAAWRSPEGEPTRRESRAADR
jgi:hypothetical protein